MHEHTNTSSTSGGSTDESFIEIWARAMAHDEEQEGHHEGHSAVKQKPVDSLKNTQFGVVAPRLDVVV